MAKKTATVDVVENIELLCTALEKQDEMALLVARVSKKSPTIQNRRRVN